MVRNVLRQVMPDSDLPLIQYKYGPDKDPAQNWDDFYTGALEQLCESRLHLPPERVEESAM